MARNNPEPMTAPRPRADCSYRNLGRQDCRANMVEATLRTVQFLGDSYEYTVTLGVETRVLTSPEPQNLKSGDRVYLELKPEGMTRWPSEG